MWITILGGPIDGSTSGLLYPSLEACEASIITVTSTMVDHYDFSVFCEETATMSKIVRPRPRPEGLMN